MTRHRFGSPGDHLVFAGLGVVVAVGLLGSALVPGVESFLDRAAVALLVLLVVVAAGWLAYQAVGEWRFERELSRPPKPVPPGYRTVMRRVDPVTGAPWVEPVSADEQSGGVR